MNITKKTQIGIVGAGAMGQGITQIAALSGLPVWLIDIDAAAAPRAKAAIAAMYDKLVAKNTMTAGERVSALARIRTGFDVGDLVECSLVIEAIVEKLEVKRSLFSQLEKIVSPDAVLASNTSSLSISAIAAGCMHPERIAGYHFFNPVPLMKVVEVVSGLRSSIKVIDFLVELATHLGHTAVRCRDMPGFIVNHAGRALNTEGLRIVQEGVTDERTVDLIVREQMGFRMGPFELLDLTGLDVSHPVMESIYRQFYDEPRFRPSPITAIRMAGGMFGQKSGEGFYKYEGGRKINGAVAQEGLQHTPQISFEGRPIWVSGRFEEEKQRVVKLLDKLNVEIESGDRPSRDALILVTPLGEDATTCATIEGLDAGRAVAVDTLFGFGPGVRRTAMPTLITHPEMLEAAQALLALDGEMVSTIHESGGFVAQRIIASIVNTACEIAQQRIATPEDIDVAVRLGLAYPLGPLALGNRIGPQRIVSVLRGLMTVYGDPRYRPSVWLNRRATLALSLDFVE